MLDSTSSPERSFAYHLAQDSWLPSVVAKTRVSLPRTAEAPRMARQSVKHAGAQLEHPEREILEILMTELVSNAVVHAGVEAGEDVILHFAVAPERIRVEVFDQGVGFSPDELKRRPRDEPGGYGLMMVDRGSSRWGASAENGTCVWFELDRAASAR